MRNPLNNYFTPNEQKVLLIFCTILLFGMGLNAFGWKPLKDRQNAPQKEKLKQAVKQDAVIKIDIRTATKEELVLLPGIGEKRAEDIMTYRQHTPFARSSDLIKIKGIGIKTYEKMLPMLVLFGGEESADSLSVGSPTKVTAPADKLITSHPPSSPKGESSIVNINTASLEELCTLSGIGW